jgi:hypothetical protein
VTVGVVADALRPKLEHKAVDRAAKAFRGDENLALALQGRQRGRILGLVVVVQGGRRQTKLTFGSAPSGLARIRGRRIRSGVAAGAIVGPRGVTRGLHGVE